MSKVLYQPLQVKEGDVIDVDTALKRHSSPDISDLAAVGGGAGWKRGRVVVKEIGEQTRKGRWCVTLLRHKHFAVISE